MLTADAKRIGVLKTPTSCQRKSLIAVLPKSQQKLKDLIDASFHTPTKATDITNTQKNLTEQKIKETRIHMRTIMSSSSGFLAQPYLTEEQLNLRTINCLKFFQKKGGYC